MPFTKNLRRGVATLLLVALAPACVHTTTTAAPYPPGGEWALPGRVDSVTEFVHRREGNPVGGAIAGALIGGFLFGGRHRGPGSLFGAAAGAAVGAAASQGTTENRSYQVVVHFSDGTYGAFVYAEHAPFRVGDAVVLTSQGLAPVPPAPPPVPLATPAN